MPVQQSEPVFRLSIPLTCVRLSGPGIDMVPAVNRGTLVNRRLDLLDKKTESGTQ
jgi:hypothetical protein